MHCTHKGGSLGLYVFFLFLYSHKSLYIYIYIYISVCVRLYVFRMLRITLVINIDKKASRWVWPRRKVRTWARKFYRKLRSLPWALLFSVAYRQRKTDTGFWIFHLLMRYWYMSNCFCLTIHPHRLPPQRSTRIYMEVINSWPQPTQWPSQTFCGKFEFLDSFCLFLYDICIV